MTTGMGTIKRLAGLDENEECELERVLSALPPLQCNKVWIAGGALRRTITGKPLDSDFDIFFRGVEEYLTYKGKLSNLGAKLHKESENADTYHVEADGKTRTVQLVKTIYPLHVADLLDAFDFTVCQLAYDGIELASGDFTLWDIGRKRLAVHKITRHVSSLRRLLKYTKEGYYACQGCLTEVLLAANAATPGQIKEVFYVD